MALNPIFYTEKIVSSFLRYQLTAYPFSDTGLQEQLRNLLNLDQVRQTPLLAGPYVSLSRSFRQGATISQLVAEGIFHSHMHQIIGTRIEHLFGHQERAIRSIHQRQTTLVSTGTGSGKTEAFLYPIISHCLQLRESKAEPGISAVLVYPMNALAEDQLDRLRQLLAGSGISFGMYVGKTPEHEKDVTGKVMPNGSSAADYQKLLEKYRCENISETIHPPEELCSREKMREKIPRILLTNIKQLELLLTRYKDAELFQNARLDYLVFDEAHTFSGIQGAETACLIRRLRTFCGKDEHDTVCIATSATIVDKDNQDAGRRFASRFFGVAPDKVTFVLEEYEEEKWSEKTRQPVPLNTDMQQLLKETLQLVGNDTEPDSQAVASLYKRLTGEDLLLMQDWRAALQSALKHNELAYQIRELIRSPMRIIDLTGFLSKRIKREISEEELLVYLALGAAAVHDGRPVFRPVIHAYIRGIPGAVVTFPDESTDKPRLWLSAEDEENSEFSHETIWRPAIHTCTVCGQHYYIHFLYDFSFISADGPVGGVLSEHGVHYWEPEKPSEMERDAGRIILVDRVISNEDDDDLDERNWSAPLYFCRYCGAAHIQEGKSCQACGEKSNLIRMYAVKSSDKKPGHLGKCVSCGALGSLRGSYFREPARPLRAITVSDVHVLAQDMIHHAERRRLLLFADNRQDAAFQAGWMKDHARRFRLLGLIHEELAKHRYSIRDLTMALSQRFDQDETMSRLLLPEVWNRAPKEAAGRTHEKERELYLRLQILRELTVPVNQAMGLEAWGRMKVHYIGLDSSHPFITEWAYRLGLPVEDLKSGVDALLDILRRRRYLYDSQMEIYNKFLGDGADIISHGYISKQHPPKGMKLIKEEGDDPKYLTFWYGPNMTLMRQAVKKWNVADDQVEAFLAELWNALGPKNMKILKRSSIKGSKGNNVAGGGHCYFIDGDILQLSSSHGFYRCRSCRRKSSRRTTNDKCLAWNCHGTMEFVREEKDNYNLQLVDQRYAMLRPEEHTAMVPAHKRERIENAFKGDGDSVNTLVCTPTLELGVDIGALDAILMRNIPPLPANYWQRAGRAGRRHRMSVILSYARPVSHDRAYFSDPLKMLEGQVKPPAFNLRNSELVKKHVHATVITFLHHEVHNSQLSDDERQHISNVLTQTLPAQVSVYLFDSARNVRPMNQPYDLSELTGLINHYHSALLDYVLKAFTQGWPEEDKDVTRQQSLADYITTMPTELEKIIKRLRKRLQWALSEMNRLESKRRLTGNLDREDKAFYDRCHRLVEKLKGAVKHRRSDAQGVDDINTFAVLAVEGFLPGYGLDTGSVMGLAEIPPYIMGAGSFELPRASGMAVREYVPGNLIYANGHKFVARRFMRDVEQDGQVLPRFEVNAARQAITEIKDAAASMDSAIIEATAVCDVDLVHQTQISDEEETRFQMSVAVYGFEKQRHGGGKAYDWGGQTLSLRRSVHLRLVNVGAVRLVEATPAQLGYPVCTICGQSVSPLSSERQIESFIKNHEDRCGTKPKHIGFYADVVADCLSLPDLPGRKEAYSVLESLRMAAASVLDMHTEDLQILVIGHNQSDTVDALLWDPMPGGSGLLQQLLDNFQEIRVKALEITADCSAECKSSCIDCLQTFRNSFYHKHLNRFTATELLEAWGDDLKFSHDIPPVLEKAPGSNTGSGPANEKEQRLKYLLEKAGFMDARFQKQIRFKHKLEFGPGIGSTTPDVFFDLDDEDEKGIAIYLDGMSEHIHGNQQTAAQDNAIRSWLRNQDYYVIEIPVNELDDKKAMSSYFYKLGKLLVGREYASRFKDDAAWWN
jgi:hypothetical protein